ncbi:MAG: hypothetical protein FK731_03675 [Asgard group archaeon]|nr:hypothetical protein [Asgard group archaeon]
MKSIKVKITFLYLSLIGLFFTIKFVGAVNVNEPVEFDYLVISEDWTFIEVSDLLINQTIDYEWISNIKVNGREVTNDQFQLLFGMDFSERAAYFESIGFTDGIFDSGRTITDFNGKIYFVFFNPEQDDATVQFTLTYRNQLLEPWVIGAISGSVTIIFLIILIVAIIKIRDSLIKKQLEEQEKSPAQRYFEM